jgi:hypothetical protein
MMNTEDEFKLEFEKLKEETHKKFKELFDKYVNAKNWEIKFDYDWCVGCSSSIDNDFSGWYDKLKDELSSKEEQC